MASRAVVILGDAVSLGQGCPHGKSFVDKAERALQAMGVVFLNWSAEDQSAYQLAQQAEQGEEIQMQLREVLQAHQEVVVVIALGNQDRVLGLEDELGAALTRVVQVCQNENARPIIMQLVPTGNIEEGVARKFGARFVAPPPSLVQAFEANRGDIPFIPEASCHTDMAKALAGQIAAEFNLNGAGGGGGGDGRMLEKRAKNKGSSLSLDGVWRHQDQPDLLEMIEGDVIVSADGRQTAIRRTGPDCFSTDIDGQHIEAKVRDNMIRWDDGDIWIKVEEDHGGLERVPDRKRKEKGDLRSLKKIWDAAEEAVNRTRVEESKRELEHERDRLNEERARLEQWRSRYEEGRHMQHEETEKLSALRAGR